MFSGCVAVRSRITWISNTALMLELFNFCCWQNQHRATQSKIEHTDYSSCLPSILWLRIQFSVSSYQKFFHWSKDKFLQVNWFKFFDQVGRVATKWEKRFTDVEDWTQLLLSEGGLRISDTIVIALPTWKPNFPGAPSTGKNSVLM